jgi:hypothetical protein
VRPSIFEATYRDYLSRIMGVDLKGVAPLLGGRVQGEGIAISLWGIPYAISREGIADPDGRQPSLDVCVILCQYILRLPKASPREKDWVAYKDLKDSGPLTVYFQNDVERAIARYFTGRYGALRGACQDLGGYSPDIQAAYDLTMQFDALPRVPVMLLFNDADDEFPARSSLLFERRAETYLDPECLAMLGRRLFTRLKDRSHLAPYDQ